MSLIVGVDDLINTVNIVSKLQKNAIRIPIAIHGKHAIGKTEVVRQITEKMGYNFVDLYLSMQEPGDLLGLPSGSEDKDGGKFTDFMCPNWLHKANTQELNTVFFLDEINRAPIMVQQVMLPFVLSGKIHTHTIKENDIIICAMNPDTGDYTVENFDDKALLSRFCHLYFEPPVTEWVDYCSSNKVHRSLLDGMSYLSKFVSDVSVDKVIKPEPDRRNLYKIGKALSVLDDKEVFKCKHLFSGMVGEEVSKFIIKQYRKSMTFDIDDIINGTVTVSGLGGSMDKIHIGCDILVDYLCSEGVYTWDAKTPSEDDIIPYEINIYIPKSENISQWIKDINEDILFRFIRSIKTMIKKEHNDIFVGIFVYNLFEELGVLNLIVDTLTNA